MINVKEIISGLVAISKGEVEFSINAKKDIMDRVVRTKNSSRNSILSDARKNICQFPLLFSDNISIDSYEQFANILEQYYTNMIKITFLRQCEILDLSKAQDKHALIARIHQNDYPNYGLSTTDDYDDGYVQTMSIPSNESAIPNTLDFYVGSLKNSDLNEACTQLAKFYIENLNINLLNGQNIESIVNEASSVGVRNIADIHTTLRGLCIQQLTSFKSYLQAKNDNDKKMFLNRIQFLSKEKAMYESILNSLSKKERLNGKNKEFKLTWDIINKTNSLLKKYSNGKLSENLAALGRSMEDDLNQDGYLDSAFVDIDKTIKTIKGLYDIIKTKQEINKNSNNKQSGGVSAVKTDSLIKKNNNLEPSILQLNMTYMSQQGTFKDTTLTIGVKCISHVIPGEEIIQYLSESIIKKKPFFRFLQWTSGEISSANFIFDVDSEKKDALSADKESVKWFRHLKARSQAAKARNFFSSKQALEKAPIKPNASLIISMEDVYYMKALNKLDILKDTKLVMKVIDMFFLMTLVIMDEGSDVLYIFNIDSKSWDKYTFSKLSNSIQTSLNNNQKVNLR